MRGTKVLLCIFLGLSNSQKLLKVGNQVAPNIKSCLIQMAKVAKKCFMLQSTHKMANLTQNEICAVLCSKRQYKQHDGEKMAM